MGLFLGEVGLLHKGGIASPVSGLATCMCLIQHRNTHERQNRKLEFLPIASPKPFELGTLNVFTIFQFFISNFLCVYYYISM